MELLHLLNPPTDDSPQRFAQHEAMGLGLINSSEGTLKNESAS